MRLHFVVRHGAPVGLALAILLAPCASAQTTIFPSFTFPASQAASDTQIGLTFDGTYYWSVRGGDSTELNESQYSAAGVLIADYAPQLDFRSIFTAGPDKILARTNSSTQIYKQTSNGVFAGAFRLQGGSLNQQSSVVLNNTGSDLEFLANSAGTVTRWDSKGQLIGTVQLIGYGNIGDEADYPQNRGIAAHGAHWFTYSNGLLSVWTSTGERLLIVILSDAGSSSNSNFSYSFTNGMFFVGDGTTWRGYALPME